MSKALDKALNKAEIPLFMLSWWANRSTIPAGFVAADGQELSRATYPDAAQGIVAGNMPLCADVDWTADPAKRGNYTLGDGANTFRVPDYNGKSSGSHGAVYLTGDGHKSAGLAGAIRQDQMQRITGELRNSGIRWGSFLQVEGALGWASFSGPGDAPASGSGLSRAVTLDSANSPDARTGTYTHGTDVSGCWVIKLFGTVVNVGSADASQLASDYANLNGALQTLDGQIDFTIIYPNGGSAESPANVTTSSRYVEVNPFPGHQIMSTAEVLYNGVWGEAPLGQVTTGGGSQLYWGMNAAQLDDGDIVLQTATNYLMMASTSQGNPFGMTGSVTTDLPCRIKVWKVKGAI